jgi:hypothetical protein
MKEEGPNRSLYDDTAYPTGSVLQGTSNEKGEQKRENGEAKEQ